MAIRRTVSVQVVTQGITDNICLRFVLLRSAESKFPVQVWINPCTGHLRLGAL